MGFWSKAKERAYRNEVESSLGIFLIFLRLGLSSFGGPIAHLAFFRDQFVMRRKWVSETAYADLVALCQFLPGPASSQVGISLGFLRRGYKGALAAWAGFTFPSALFLILFALGISSFEVNEIGGVIHGLKIVALAIVAQAVWGMAQGICKTRLQVWIMSFSACVALLVPGIFGQLAIIILAGIFGMIFLRAKLKTDKAPLANVMSKKSGIIWLLIFISLLFALPILSRLNSSGIILAIDGFYRVGSLVFGGGHVVLPLLQAETVANGWLSNETFLAGYGAAQAVPGPLFTFAAFLGAELDLGTAPWIGGLICLLAIFAPSFFLIFGALPFWNDWRRNLMMQSALLGVNSAVVGLLLAALYDPIWISAIKTRLDFSFVLIAFIALQFGKVPPWLVVLLSALLTYFFS